MKQAALIVAIAYVACTVPAFAAEETILCSMTKKAPGGAAESFLQKFELDFDARSVVNVENWGSGWEETGRGQFVDADDAGITLEDNALIHTYINRGTGKFYGEIRRDFSKQERGGSETVSYKQGTVFRGQCKQLGARPARNVL